MRKFWEVGQWGGRLRLAWAVCTGALFLTLWVLQQAGSWPTRIWGALLAACAPIVVAWPFLLPKRRGHASRAPEPPPFSGSLTELDLLRRTGAI